MCTQHAPIVVDESIEIDVARFGLSTEMGVLTNCFFKDLQKPDESHLPVKVLWDGETVIGLTSAEQVDKLAFIGISND